MNQFENLPIWKLNDLKMDRSRSPSSKWIALKSTNFKMDRFKMDRFQNGPISKWTDFEMERLKR